MPKLLVIDDVMLKWGLGSVLQNHRNMLRLYPKCEAKKRIPKSEKLDFGLPFAPELVGGWPDTPNRRTTNLASARSTQWLAPDNNRLLAVGSSQQPTDLKLVSFLCFLTWPWTLCGGPFHALLRDPSGPKPWSFVYIP